MTVVALVVLGGLAAVVAVATGIIGGWHKRPASMTDKRVAGVLAGLVALVFALGATIALLESTGSPSPSAQGGN